MRLSLMLSFCLVLTGLIPSALSKTAQQESTNKPQAGSDSEDFLELDTLLYKPLLEDLKEIPPQSLIAVYISNAKQPLLGHFVNVDPANIYLNVADDLLKIRLNTISKALFKKRAGGPLTGNFDKVETGSISDIASLSRAYVITKTTDQRDHKEIVKALKKAGIDVVLPPEKAEFEIAIKIDLPYDPSDYRSQSDQMRVSDAVKCTVKVYSRTREGLLRLSWKKTATNPVNEYMGVDTAARQAMYKIAEDFFSDLKKARKGDKF